MRLALLALVLCGCGVTGPSQPPSAATAEAFLSEVVDRAQSGDFDALCQLGGGNCEDFLALDGGREVPEARPTVVGGRVIQPTGDNAGRVGGHVLEICGRTDAGELYYSEMLVFYDHIGELHGMEPEYWMGIRIAEDGTAGQHIGEDASAECEGAV